MSATTPCTPCCADTQVTNVPGPEGPDGGDGTDGQNAYTLTTANFVVPAVGANVAVAVENSDWMAIGQIVVTDGPATFRVVSTGSSTTATLTFLGETGDVAVGATVTAGATVSPGGVAGLGSSLSVYASGTAYALTATAAKLDFGTTDPSLIITSPGTWLIKARIRYDYVGATFAASRTVTSKLRRTNNSAGDLTNGTAGWLTDIITTLTYTAVIQEMPAIVYQTLNSTDVIELWGSVSVVPTAGALNAVEAEIVAIKLTS